jgi:hypothetical protein
MMLSPLAGLTSTNGSTSLLRKFLPVWPARPQFDPANGLVPDTWTRELATYELAHATCGTKSTIAARHRAFTNQETASLFLNATALLLS